MTRGATNRLQSRLIMLGAGLVLLPFTNIGVAQEKKDSKRFKSTVLELTDDAPSRWILKEAKAGAPIMSDRDYKFVELPEDVNGGTLLFRSAQDSGSWLDTGQMRALKDATVYIAIRWKVRGKEIIDEVTRTKIERDGWEEVEGKTSTTCPDDADWRWKTYSKKIKKGDVVLLLKTTSWQKQWSVLFIFK